MNLHYSYKITNLINNKYYYGIRRTYKDTDVFGDKYFGSGKILKTAIDKYGLENFTKEIVYVFGDRKEAYDWERETVTIDLVNDPMCYNIKLGGEGGSGTLGLKGWWATETNKKRTGINHPFYGKTRPPHSEETKRKQSLATKGIPRGPFSEEHCHSISKSKIGNTNGFKSRAALAA